MAEPMTPEILRTLLTDLTLSNHARAAILAAVDAWDAQADGLAGALADLSMAYAGIRKRLETAEEQLAVNVDFVKQYQALAATPIIHKQPAIAQESRDADRQKIAKLEDCNMKAAELHGWCLERLEFAHRALRQLTFSPDGLPDTWPSAELVATILAGEEPLPYQPGYEREEP